MAECDHTVKAELVQVGRLELEHDLDAAVADLLAWLEDALATLLEAVAGLDELLAVLDEQVVHALLADSRDLDELRRAVADLPDGERLEERKVEEGVQRGVVRAQAVLELVVVEPDLDRDRGVDQADQGGGDADKVGRPAVGRAGVAGDVGDETTADDKDGLLADETLLVEEVDLARGRGMSARSDEKHSGVTLTMLNMVSMFLLISPPRKTIQERGSL